ncbi:MAG: DedA family protein [Micromonosporaceae bacterium]|nr:DedA family protein [Micromonosporaceae bacterium]
MGAISDWLGTLPALVVYLLVAGIIAAESMGIPLPGEIGLVSAALLAADGHADIAWVAVAASAGAIGGDSLGYLIGHKGGRPLLVRLGRRFPRHLGPAHVARAEAFFARWGSWAIFFGRFVALLRILAGPLAGVLRVPYPKFLLANAAGGICWASGTAVATYYAGRAAERWLQDFSWVALVAAVLGGIGTTLVLRARTRRAVHAEQPAAPEQERERATPEPAEAG